MTTPQLKNLSKYVSGYTILVFLAMVVAWCLRTQASNFVFLTDGTIKLTTNDAWFHMRAIETLLQNYPNRLYYDPWTNYPYGSLVHFGPLFEHIVAIAALIIGFGSPSHTLLYTIGAFVPVVYATLTVIPVYYIGKYIGGRNAGVVGAFAIALAPGQILSRSTLGFMDNHIAEVFFSTAFIALFMYATILAKRENLTFDDIKNKNIGKFKKPLFFAIFAGVMYAAYQLAWTGAPLFAFIVCVYALVQYNVNNVLWRESSDYLGIVGIVTFITSAILVLPAIHSDMGFVTYFYSWFTVIVPLGTVASFVGMSIIEKYLTSNKFPYYYYPIAVVIIAGIGITVIGLISASLYDSITVAPRSIFALNIGGATTIAEAASIFYPGGGAFTLSMVFGNFTPQVFLASLVGILALIFNVFDNSKKQERVMLLVWSIIILFAIYAQNRFAYYYSVNCAILCAYLSGILFERVKFDEMLTEIKKNFITKASLDQHMKAIKVQSIVVLLLILCGVIYPSYVQSIPYTQGVTDPTPTWIDACTWLKDNTPDPGMDFYGIYTAPPEGTPFNYPDTAYGVMSWWDYGHYIEIFGHRMPNANPFQSGVGGRRSQNGDVIPGASPFFTAPTEADATKVLMDIDKNSTKPAAKYIMSDYKMATDIFLAMPEWMFDDTGYMQPYWTGTSYQYIPSMRYYNSMEARLHIFDGSGLKQYRMVYETPAFPTQESMYRKIYNFIYEGHLNESDTGNVKIFEVVKGATITGHVSPSTPIKVSTTIRTNQNRTFVYEQNTTTDYLGYFNFTVPYSNTDPIKGQTQFAVKAITPYVIQYDTFTMPITVTESEVLNGTVVKMEDRVFSGDTANYTLAPPSTSLTS